MDRDRQSAVSPRRQHLAQYLDHGSDFREALPRAGLRHATPTDRRRPCLTSSNSSPGAAWFEPASARTGTVASLTISIPKNSAVYRRNWGDGILTTADVRALTTKNLPGAVDLAWASFPCQDLSLAGRGAGLKGDRSGTFWPFWTLMKDLIAEGRPPRIIALENVCGTLTSHDGKDFAAICSTFERAGYVIGAVVIDAALFVPHSRPRLFMIGVHGDLEIPAALTQSVASPRWHTRGLRAALDSASAKVRKNWIWWSLPEPARRNTTFADLVEDR